MKDTIKQLLREALGVPDNITNVGVEVYNKVLDYLNQQPADMLMTDIPNKIKITGEYKVGDTVFNKVKLKLNTKVLKRHDNNLPKVYGMAFRNKSQFDAQLFRNISVGKDGSVYLFIEIAINRTTTVEEVLEEFVKEKIKLTMALTHELKHAYDMYKNKVSKIHRNSEYGVFTNMRTNIPPLDQFIHDLYFTTNAENLVRATEVASNIEQVGITKKQFLNFLETDDTYQNLKRINSFSLDGLINDLKQHKDRIIKVLDDAGYKIPASEDDLISLLLKLTYQLIQSRKFDAYKDAARLNDPFVSMLLQSNSVSRKEIKDYVDTLKGFDTYQQFFNYEQKNFKTVTDKLLKKIHKLYAMAKDDDQSDAMQKINARTTNESILDWDLYYEANNIGETNPFKKDEESN
jgi:hypothetical protein